MELWYYIACFHSFTHQFSECWNVCISRRPVQELWLYRSDILCCFWHPVTFSSVSSWFKLALERVGPGAGGKARPSSPAPAPRWLRRAAEPGLGAAPAQGSAHTQTSGGFCFPSHYLHTILSAILRRTKLFSPITSKIQGSFQSGTHYQLALVFSLCANCAYVPITVIS